MLVESDSNAWVDCSTMTGAPRDQPFIVFGRSMGQKERTGLKERRRRFAQLSTLPRRCYSVSIVE
jgi:hypothetical protein